LANRNSQVFKCFAAISSKLLLADFCRFSPEKMGSAAHLSSQSIQGTLLEIGYQPLLFLSFFKLVSSPRESLGLAFFSKNHFSVL
jgi:hypothetical protein